MSVPTNTGAIPPKAAVRRVTPVATVVSGRSRSIARGQHDGGMLPGILYEVRLKTITFLPYSPR
jgi:hypothetical protein